MIIDIKNSYVGDASVSRLYQGETLVWDASHPDILLDWIANGEYNDSKRQNVYFDTGFTADCSTSVELKYEASTVNTTLGTFFGAKTDDNTRFVCTAYVAGSSTVNMGSITTTTMYFAGGKFGFGYDFTVNTPHILKFAYDGATMYRVIDSSSQTSARSQAYFSSGYSMYLFASNYAGTVDNKCKGGVKFYYVKIWEANNLIRFYIPVLHYINGQYTPCFYDKVNDTYIYNLGTDEVVYKISGDYLLDYIANGPDASSASTMQVYYNVGIIADASIMGEMKTAIPAYKGQWFCGACLSNFVGFEMGVSAYKKPYTRLGTYLENGNTAYTNEIQLNTPYTTVLFHDGTNQITYFNAEKATTTSGNVNAGSFSSTTPMHLFARAYGDLLNTASSYSGMKIYYANYSYNNIPSKNLIPVLHNSQPAFLDLNSNTYIYNLGTDTPVYSFQK